MRGGLGRKEGLEERIEIRLEDYRETKRIEGGSDRVVSVEMLEHVGREWMDGYFGCIRALLNEEHGVAVVQGIAIIIKVCSSSESVLILKRNSVLIIA